MVDEISTNYDMGQEHHFPYNDDVEIHKAHYEKDFPIKNRG